MKKYGFIAVFAAFAVVSCSQKAAPLGLKDVLGDKFLVGTALNEAQILHMDAKADSLVALHFNAIVPENCMKHENLHPAENEFDFELSDKFVEYGEAAGLTMTGHCLIWHSQTADWMFKDEKGGLVSPEVLKQRMKDHIYAVAGRYKGKLKGWDVVNEAIIEDGSYRNSYYYQILGEEFIPWAFQCAHEADPDAELYYNDYGMHEPGRRDGVVRLIRQLKERGLRIDAIGMQGHMGMDYPTIEDFRTSMEAFIAEGVNVMITEWDMSVNPTKTQSADIAESQKIRTDFWNVPEEEREELYNNFLAIACPYAKTGVPEDVMAAWSARMREFMDLFIEHADKLTRVTVWGVTDETSWKNNFPIPGGTDFALPFDREYNAKPFVNKLIEDYKK
ncbi:MAG: endo-1,4-beta-xylanase [Bacteroidota bacterium]|nr:endo-1,4-beta-xylanase [Bacteroidota bacterium]